jgi:hypothetical protein
MKQNILSEALILTRSFNTQLANLSSTNDQKLQAR